MRQETPGCKSAADTKKLCYSSLLFANIQTLKIKNADPDPYFLDKKVQYIALEKFIETGVLTAQSNQLRLA